MKECTTKNIEPTTYGLFCHMYPHVDFIVDLLAKIHADNTKIINPSPEQLQAIRNDILAEKVTVQIPNLKHPQVEGQDQVMHKMLTSTSCRDIISEAMQRNYYS